MKYIQVIMFRQNNLLTSYLQGGIPADSLTQVVSSDTNIHAFIRFTPPSMHDAQEKEGATGQQHAMRPGVFLVRLHPLTIFVPLNDGRGPPFSFAVECRWFPLGYNEVGRMLYYPWR